MYYQLKNGDQILVETTIPIYRVTTDWVYGEQKNIICDPHDQYVVVELAEIPKDEHPNVIG